MQTKKISRLEAKIVPPLSFPLAVQAGKQNSSTPSSSFKFRFIPYKNNDMKKRQRKCYSKAGMTVQKPDSSGTECEKHYCTPQCRKAQNDVP